ncbi:HNH endonuclease signature motif containing protein [Cryobacterium sp. MLB-32]|uniref:HNH endonuclease signature motif containing protein n=1 Tax=Cryobacterium sp. MLB-32 TaxID=1529318 RepID=UPI00068B88BE|nr:HNH endonuclease signature motif containing protein [Cryobacterium sp. MLB-32]
MKKYLQIRDETCRVQGCNKAVRYCDIDHTIDRQFGGPTTNVNLSHLCAADHALKHNTAWTVTQTADGVMHWTSPAGKHYATDPATRIIPPLKPPSTKAPHPPDTPHPPSWFDIPDTRNPDDPAPF